MAELDITIVHVLAADMAGARLDALQALRNSPHIAARHALLQVSRRTTAALAALRPIRVSSPLCLAPLRRHALIRAAACGGLSTAAPGLSAGAKGVIWHTWSDGAAQWCLPLGDAGHRLLIEVDNLPPKRCCRSAGRAATIVYACRSASAQACLRACGIPDERCVRIPPAVDDHAANPDWRPRVRAQLELAGDHLAVLVLPPLTRAAGSFIGAWATLLLEKVCPCVRLIVPAGGDERDRIRRLVQACRHEHVARFAPPVLTIRELLAAADLAVHVPADDTALDGVACAMASGCPLVATDVAAVREWPTHGRNAWLCQPNDPQDAARRLLRALEQPEVSRRQAAQAHADALILFSRSRMRAAYQAAYAGLLAR